MISPLSEAAVEVGAFLLAAPDAAVRASIIASAVIEQFPDSACAVHRHTGEDGETEWSVVGLSGEISIQDAALEGGNRLINALLTNPFEAIIYQGASIRREDYAHLHVSRSVASIACIPLLHESLLIGAIEILSFSAALRPQDLEAISPIVQLAAPAILSAEEAETQRQDLLDSVHRMSQLYDLEKSLNATLEFDAVVAAVPVKVSAMLACQAIHLWLFDGAALRLVSSAGEDATVQVGSTQAAGEGYVGDMAEEGEPLLIDDSDDERLARRNAGADVDGTIPPVANALLVPLLQDEAEVGVLEAVNKDGQPFDEDDQFLLVSMAETVSSALKNASLMLAERKLEILKALVNVSSEITSTLRLDRLLQIIANSPQSVLPYERCAIALDHRGRLQLKAVSGMSSLPLGDAQVGQLHELMRWLSSQFELQHLRMREDAGESENPDLPEPVLRHFEQTGAHALYALPLTDDQGRVGMLVYESSDPDFLELPHTEMIKVLAGQATVAIRNALLYREVPLISLIEPLVRKRRALMSNRRGRWMIIGVLLECALFLSFFPLPMRVSGDAVVAPQHLVSIAAPVDGNITAVYAHEGQHVAASQVLGAMNDWQWRSDLAAAESKYHQATLTMQNDLAHGAAQAGADRAQAEYLRAELERAQARVDSAQLRSPIDGIVVTPDLQNVAGKHLDAGVQFAQVLDLSTAMLQIAVPERDTALLSAGQNAAIKLDSYPQRTWHGRVSVVSPQARAGDGERTFTAEVPLSNADANLRSGMTGRAKISIGWRPAGYVLLRRPALWTWQTLWNWIGW
jgi:RND family efflux transporter MFP subunit